MKIFTKDRLTLLAVITVLVVLGIVMGRRLMVSTPPPAPPPPAMEEPRNLREVILYFGDPGGSYLAAEAREIEDCPNEADCIASTVRALADGPLGDLVPVIPSHAIVRGVSVEEGTATVDFGRELISAHPGGSGSELLTTYGLANTLAVNFPHIRQVQILVEGAAVETIKGHVDLRSPIPADFDFSRPPEGWAPGFGEEGLNTPAASAERDE
ncbi:MAG: sporulation protein [Desulfuromonas sp.]|uniref:GerMN domain-containing protein n=1 Tax=Desulfuromonas sp. TaxID=892 RepID=UPI000CAFF348|nr:GerMN domain-containing protein [Desulfuromonas sp.]PLX82360.1 MAG: sporulation protein [Desulfuromonas sp.]